MKTIFAVLLILLTTVSAYGQETMPFITYTVGIPSGDLGDWISETSWYGFEVGSRVFPNDNYSYGFSTGWNLFSEKSTELEQVEGGAVWGTRIREVRVFPLLVNAHYYFGGKRKTRPYVGLNTGVYFISQDTTLGAHYFGDSNAQFGLSPEIGVIAPVGDMGLMLNVKYAYAFEGGATMPFSWFAVNLGFTFPDF